MSATIKWLDSDSEVELSSNTIEQELVLIGSGAQGAVYKWDSGKGPMALKVLFDTNIFDRVSEISKRIASGPDSLKKRGVPVAYGVGQSSDFGLTSSSHVVILVFNYINGVYLHEAVEDEGPASDLRKMLTKEMLAAFEYLETFGVPVLGYQTKELPAFYTQKSGFDVNFEMKSAAEIAQLLQTKWALHLKGGVIVANPVPKAEELDYDIMQKAIDEALIAEKELGIKGKASTPFLLAKVKEITKGMSLDSNIALVYNNAKLAAQIAVAMQKDA